VRRALLDTNIYIGWMNGGEHEALVTDPGLIRHMSAVVLMELETGATTPAARRAIGHLSRAFERTGRLVSPSTSAYKRAGGVLRALRAGGREVRRSSLAHDVLIALTARDLGATVFTQNGSDFSAIRKHVDFALSVV